MVSECSSLATGAPASVVVGLGWVLVTAGSPRRGGWTGPGTGIPGRGVVAGAWLKSRRRTRPTQDAHRAARAARVRVPGAVSARADSSTMTATSDRSRTEPAAERRGGRIGPVRALAALLLTGLAAFATLPDLLGG